MYNVYDVFLSGPRVTVWRCAIPSLNLSAAAHLCMIYPLHYVSSSVSVVIALFFLVALYVCIYCIFSEFLLLLGGDIRTYTCVYASSYNTFVAIVKLLVSSPSAQSISIHCIPFELSEITREKEKLPLRPLTVSVGFIARERTSDKYHARATQRIRESKNVTTSMLNKTVN